MRARGHERRTTEAGHTTVLDPSSKLPAKKSLPPGGRPHTTYPHLHKHRPVTTGERSPIARRDLYSGDRLKVEVARDGKPARTLYRVLRRHAGLTLLEARLTTGRTHQIRAHLRHEGHPVAGDPVYGDRALNEALRGRHGLWRQWLHAWRVGLVHPVTGEGLDLVAPLPEDLRKVLEGEGFGRDAVPDGAWKA